MMLHPRPSMENERTPSSYLWEDPIEDTESPNHSGLEPAIAAGCDTIDEELGCGTSQRSIRSLIQARPISPRSCKLILVVIALSLLVLALVLGLAQPGAQPSNGETASSHVPQIDDVDNEESPEWLTEDREVQEQPGTQPSNGETASSHELQIDDVDYEESPDGLTKEEKVQEGSENLFQGKDTFSFEEIGEDGQEWITMGRETESEEDPRTLDHALTMVEGLP